MRQRWNQSWSQSGPLPTPKFRSKSTNTYRSGSWVDPHNQLRWDREGTGAEWTPHHHHNELKWNIDGPRARVDPKFSSKSKRQIWSWIQIHRLTPLIQVRNTKQRWIWIQIWNGSLPLPHHHNELRWDTDGTRARVDPKFRLKSTTQSLIWKWTQIWSWSPQIDLNLHSYGGYKL